MARGKIRLSAMPGIQYALRGGPYEGVAPQPTRMRMPAARPHVAFANPANARELAQHRSTQTRVVNQWEAMAVGATPADFQRYRLQSEMVPEDAQGKNLRRLLTDATWAAIRKQKALEANHVCEICGEPTPRPDCHEQWSYLDEPAHRGIQRLDGLCCLCRDCHAAKHLGFSLCRQRDSREKLDAFEVERLAAVAAGLDPDAVVGREVLRDAAMNGSIFDRAMAKLQQVNRIGRDEANAYLRWMLSIQRERHLTVWRMNLDWLLDWLSMPERTHIALRWKDTPEVNEDAARLIGRCAARPRMN